MAGPLDADLPDAAVLALWLDAWLCGHAPTDDLLQALGASAAAHHVVPRDGTSAEPLALALGTLRRGCTGAGLALPVAGDPTGLAGPRAFNDAALEAEEALHLLGTATALVPRRTGAGVVWTTYAATHPRPVPALPDASRALRLALVGAAEALADLDVARWRPEVADELISLRRPRPEASVPGMSAAAAETLAQATTCRRIVALALEDDGAAVSAEEVRARADALRPLDHAARHALVAACSADAQR